MFVVVVVVVVVIIIIIIIIIIFLLLSSSFFFFLLLFLFALPLLLAVLPVSVRSLFQFRVISYNFYNLLRQGIGRQNVDNFTG
jgi:hypothetical protein